MRKKPGTIVTVLNDCVLFLQVALMAELKAVSMVARKDLRMVVAMVVGLVVLTVQLTVVLKVKKMAGL